jgi:hypothetical protein
LNLLFLEITKLKWLDFKETLKISSPFRKLFQHPEHLQQHTLFKKKYFSTKILFNTYCQPQAKAKAKAMPGRLYIHNE